MPGSAQTFRSLHHQSTVLRLPNAWDAGSARLFESLGATAIATTSAGVAWAQGYADGRVFPVDIAVSAAASIARLIKVPLSVDIENGYSDDPQTVAENVKRVLEVGAVGINLEDGSDAPELLARKIEAIKSMAASNGFDVFINARTDVYLASLVAEHARVEESLKRGQMYREAGADGLFVAALVDIEQIKTVVAGVNLPINLLARQGLPAADALAALGVRRLSAGSTITQTLWGQAEQLARGFLQEGRSEAVTEGSLTYPQIQALFER
ncbi:isocitrate lyase/phosphoenolpyruvate mutase family protein [Pseudomonas sp. KU26590]|uniref:isocitrate lyase/PEP mutase family protein n=1 Tax=Pseudomonas sp. KU26590 TaxID=2991051 RepID=UPI00223CC343|nr:isocitrate lyase/phosphoenolpyruvate mutase family protein [Pseudomonas sp. KU26590]UZJ58307.1 isocitrate lyase/phosphoenolpyruvate mutase family protein [Pseudomonas sp. KU26590]